MINSRILKNSAPFWLSTCLVLLFFHSVLFSANTFFLRDIHRWFYPAKDFLSQAFQGGVIPYWCPNYFCGSPFLSDLQSGVFYPLSLIFAVFAFPWSFNLYVCLHFFLGYLFCYGFLRSLDMSSKTATLTSVSFCYGSFVMASVNTLNNLSTAIWLPAVLWAFRVARSRNSLCAYGLGVLSLSFCLLGGEPQLFMLTIIILAVFAVSPSPNEPPVGWTHRTKGLLALVFAVLAAFLITTAQLGPTFGDYRLSVRAEGFSLEEAGRFSIHPSMIKHFFVPLIFPPGFEKDPAFLSHFFPGSSGMPWLLTVYPGAIIIPLAALSLLSGYRKFSLAWLLVFIASIAFALGEHAPFFRLFHMVLPGFRFPGKFIFSANFSLLMMAAYGTEHILDFLKGRRKNAAFVFQTLLILLVLDLFWTHRHLNPVYEYDTYRKYHPHLQTILDDPSHFRVYVDSESLSTPGENPSILDHHTEWQMLLMPNLGILHGLNHVDGVTGMELRYQYLITEILNKPWSQRIRFLKLANVKYIISRQDLDARVDLGGQVERINPLVLKIKEPLPRAWIVGQLTPLRRGSIEELLEPSFDPFLQVIVGGKIPELSQTAFFQEAESVQYEKGGRIRIRAVLDRPGILVLSESSYPGWRVFVNGKERECLWLNLLFQGVQLSPGKKEILFQFRPKHFSLFATVSLLSLGIVFSAFSVFFFLRKGNPQQTNRRGAQ